MKRKVPVWQGSAGGRRPRMFPSESKTIISLGAEIVEIDDKTKQLKVKGIPVVATTNGTNFIVGNHPKFSNENKTLNQYYSIEQDKKTYEDYALYHDDAIEVQGPDPNWTNVNVNFDPRLLGGFPVGNYYYPSVAFQKDTIGRAGAHYIWKAQEKKLSATKKKGNIHIRKPADAYINPMITTSRQISRESQKRALAKTGPFKLQPKSMESSGSKGKWWPGRKWKAGGPPQKTVNPVKVKLQVPATN